MWYPAKTGDAEKHDRIAPDLRENVVYWKIPDAARCQFLRRFRQNCRPGAELQAAS